MEVLFCHPNFPGQFRRVAKAFSQIPGLKVYGFGDAQWIKGHNRPGIPEIELITYEPAPKAQGHEHLHPFVRNYNDAVLRAEQALGVLVDRKTKGLEPDVIFTHPGWGDAFYMRDIFPGAKVIGLFEYYYNARGADLGFDPEFPSRINDVFRVRSLNATQLQALDSCDKGFCPTAWQRSRFPEVWQTKLDVLHDGIDTMEVKPDSTMAIELKDGTVLRAGDEILTYVSRHFEPYRGYHTFMRALPTIMAERPNCHVVIAGGDDQGYGPPPPDGQSYKDIFLDEVKGRLDMSRVHFTGHLAYENFLRLMQVSRLHVYLTYPFILSWSMLEAMAAGCLVLGSATPPVEEVITNGVNGLLTPFHSPGMLADRAITALANPERYSPLRAAARQTIIDRYDFNTVSLPAFLRLLHS